MTIKEKVVHAVQDLPDDASIADAMKRLCFLSKVEKGLQQADSGQTIPRTQVREKTAEYDMLTVADKVFDEALSLPADDRLGLVEKLLCSLNLPTQCEIDSLWAEEAERRVGEIDRGEVELIPGEKVFEKIRQKYAR